jgi:hypothetical protein
MMHWYQDWTWWGVIAVAVAFAVLAVRLAQSKPRYEDPQLHEGPWQLVGIVQHEATWRRTQSAYVGGTSHSEAVGHIPHECRIGRGLSHVDACACGAIRYGVHGKWEAA